MSDKPAKLIVPKDPVQIGKTRNGEPVWLDPKDLIPTPDEELERWDKTLDSRQRGMIDKAAKLVLMEAIAFLEQTVLATASKSFVEHYQSGTEKQVRDTLSHSGYEVIQDGLTTVVKLKGKILREMTADVTPRWRDFVARRVNQMVKAKQCPI